MKNHNFVPVTLLFLLFVVFLQFSAVAQQESGRLYKFRLDNAPFPDPGRASGYNGLSYAGHYDDNTVAVYIPPGYKDNGSTDIVFYFHGWYNTVDGVLSGFKMIEQFLEARKNAILVIPEGPKNAADSYYGKLERENGFLNLVMEILDSLKGRTEIEETIPGKIVVACHSGGVRVLSKILKQGGVTHQIRDVYLFDATYGYIDEYLDWLMTFEGKLISIWTEGSGTRDGTMRMIQRLKDAGIPFLNIDEVNLTKDDLIFNRIVIIKTPLAHSDLVFLTGNFTKFLNTSMLDLLEVR
ncbi:MAG: hypothetical protein LC102_06670 [Ignavibacteriales bacterium]|nr:MAG: hypothetical protein F9K26_11840 [Ignavibacteriaceae bacterium]MBW7873991.1 hypothetical protein [Ignavibacteria bacterium]MCZ2143092.1 hypothetical protein [Ignavibacteriales bacterium]OQY78765.1 MAG: hypothetical protein B6D45_01940 [Ignavibacteriales bacterium UTCHB3]MBV6443973.1 hypothetical protein [Ignavibacteriaceae bacterium]